MENAPGMSGPPPPDSASDPPPPSRIGLAAIDALRSRMPLSHFVTENTALDAEGNLLVEGVARASWGHCLKIEGLDWEFLEDDLRFIFLDHEHCFVGKPMVFGYEGYFIPIAFTNSITACEKVIRTLDGASVAGGPALRVRFATEEDLTLVLAFQGTVPAYSGSGV